jgi:hypothetical protein
MPASYNACFVAAKWLLLSASSTVQRAMSSALNEDVQDQLLLRTACDAPTAQNLSTPTPSGSQQHSRTLRHHHHRRRRRRASTQHREHRPARERTYTQRRRGTRTTRKFDSARHPQDAWHVSIAQDTINSNACDTLHRIATSTNYSCYYEYTNYKITSTCIPEGHVYCVHTVLASTDTAYSGVCRVCAEQAKKVEVCNFPRPIRFIESIEGISTLYRLYACRILQHSCTCMLDCVCTVQSGSKRFGN